MNALWIHIKMYLPICARVCFSIHTSIAEYKLLPLDCCAFHLHRQTSPRCVKMYQSTFYNNHKIIIMITITIIAHMNLKDFYQQERFFMCVFTFITIIKLTNMFI